MGERDRCRREQWPVSPNPIDDRLGHEPICPGTVPEDDPERLATTELDENGLSRKQRLQACRNSICESVGTRGAGRVDGDLYEAPRPGIPVIHRDFGITRGRVDSRQTEGFLSEVGGHDGAPRSGSDASGTRPSREG